MIKAVQTIDDTMEVQREEKWNILVISKGFVGEKMLEMSFDREENKSWWRRDKNSELSISMSKDPLRGRKYRVWSRDGKGTSLAKINQSRGPTMESVKTKLRILNLILEAKGSY